jgi:hypothetical protein
VRGEKKVSLRFFKSCEIDPQMSFPTGRVCASLEVETGVLSLDPCTLAFWYRDLCCLERGSYARGLLLLCASCLGSSGCYGVLSSSFDVVRLRVFLHLYDARARVVSTLKSGRVRRYLANPASTYFALLILTSSLAYHSPSSRAEEMSFQLSSFTWSRPYMQATSRVACGSTNLRNAPKVT